MCIQHFVHDQQDHFLLRGYKIIVESIITHPGPGVSEPKQINTVNIFKTSQLSSPVFYFLIIALPYM